MNQDNKHRMVSLLGSCLNKLVTVYTDAGTNYTGVLKEIKPEIIDNYIILSTWDSSSQKVDGSKIVSFYCGEDGLNLEVRELIGKFYENRRKS